MKKFLLIGTICMCMFSLCGCGESHVQIGSSNSVVIKEGTFEKISMENILVEEVLIEEVLH